MSRLAKNYQQASFKNALFKVDAADTDLGRRVALHEYPLRDTPNSEDLGRKSRQFSIEAYVLGENYEQARDALIEACEAPGAGQFVHPYLGTKRVVCTGCRVRENKSELGIAYFSLTFIEAGEEIFPSQSTDKLTSLSSKVSNALDSSRLGFEKRFSVSGAPSFVVDSAAGRVNIFANLVETVAQKSRASAQGLADLTYKIRNIRATVQDIIRTPSELSAQMQSAINDLVNLVPGNNKAAKDSLASMLSYGTGFAAIPITTENRRREKENSDALVDLVRQSATAELALVTAQDEYVSYEDATLARDNFTSKADLILFATEDDDVFESFQVLRTETIKAVPPNDSDLPNLSEYNVGATVPTIVVVYDLYNDLAREQDLIDRNKIRNPAFIRQDTTLEVVKVPRL